MPGFVPDFRLVLSNPVGLGFFPKAVNRVFEPGEFEQPAPRAFHRTINPGVALIQPDNSRAQRLAMFVEVDHRAALGCYGNAYNPAWRNISRLPQLIAGLAQVFPEILWMLFCPARAVSYTHLRAHETDSYLVCRLL